MKNLSQFFRNTLLLATPFLLFTGCIPPAVVWTPDSDAIIFTDTKKASETDSATLVEYHLATKTRRVIVDNTETRTPWPGLSPDGKHIAVTKAETIKERGSRIETRRLTIRIYDRQGKLLKDSKPYEETEEKRKPADDSENELSPLGAMWVTANHIITPIAIYHVDRGSWVSLDQVIPLWMMNPPTRPDGRGYLAIQDTDGDNLICFITMDGEIHHFMETKVSDKLVGDIVDSTWEGPTAVLTAKNGLFKLNTETMKVSQTTIDTPIPNILSVEGKLEAYYRFRDNGAHLCVVDAKDEEAKGTSWWLELQFPNTKERKVILTDKDYEKEPEDLLFPSRDGTKVAVLFDGKNEDHIVLIDSSGKILGTVDRNQKE